MKQILDGDKALYAKIVRTYQENVVNLCYRIAGNGVDLQEAAQQVFVELYSALPRFRGEARLGTYIYRITVNVVIKMLKDSHRVISLEQGWLPEPAHRSNGEESLIRAEEEQRLRKAVGRLRADQRTALVLYAFKDLSYEEVAEVLGVSESRVSMLLFRAKNRLREILGAPPTFERENRADDEASESENDENE